ncbi:histone H4 [Tanacetum coccineum]
MLHQRKSARQTHIRKSRLQADSCLTRVPLRPTNRPSEILGKPNIWLTYKKGYSDTPQDDGSMQTSSYEDTVSDEATIFALEGMEIFLENVIRYAVTYTKHARRKTVTAMDVVYALKRQRMTLYGFRDKCGRRVTVDDVIDPYLGGAFLDYVAAMTGFMENYLCGLSNDYKQQSASVGIKSLLDAVRITAAHVYVNAAQLELVLLRDFKENMLSVYYC